MEGRDSGFQSVERGSSFASSNIAWDATMDSANFSSGSNGGEDDGATTTTIIDEQVECPDKNCETCQSIERIKTLFSIDLDQIGASSFSIAQSTSDMDVDIIETQDPGDDYCETCLTIDHFERHLTTVTAFEMTRPDLDLSFKNITTQSTMDLVRPGLEVLATNTTSQSRLEIIEPDVETFATTKTTESTMEIIEGDLDVLIKTSTTKSAIEIIKEGVDTLTTSTANQSSVEIIKPGDDFKVITASTQFNTGIMKPTFSTTTQSTIKSLASKHKEQDETIQIIANGFKPISVEMKKTDTVDKLLSEISRKSGRGTNAANSSSLIFKGETLRGSDTLRKAKLENKSKVFPVQQNYGG